MAARSFQEQVVTMADSKPVNELPRMVPDRDEIRTRKGSGQESKPTGSGSGDKPTPPARRGGAGPLVWVALLVLFAALVGVGLMAYSQNQMLASYEERLQLADDRISSLERSMNETGESVAMNETAINAQFRAIKSETDMQMSEIRKLWDVSNKRNREWIEENQQAIGKLQTDLQAQTDQLAALSSSLDQQSQTLDTLAGRLDSQQESASQRAETLTSVQQQLTTLNEDLASIDLASLEERLISLTLGQETLQQEQGDMRSNVQSMNTTVQELNETIQAIDASRLDTNRRLVTLNDQLQALEAKVSALTGSSQ
ncbi:hypothetical protein [Saccharospirillum salsuginis]|uniref:Uncharacterized protein n=1 Tax=Saccharospirillum salsuginis TaxID=418750 RepID=A0A918NEL2_9GAMM|nr:hypothetical protein [Saccharospirillum salsuginis]GGX61445.1 hypothetical protein GCM10007392_31630 [Saccharospirillum salsuginis]